jgi:hypothetical protein
MVYIPPPRTDSLEVQVAQIVVAQPSVRVLAAELTVVDDDFQELCQDVERRGLPALRDIDDAIQNRERAWDRREALVSAYRVLYGDLDRDDILGRARALTRS